MIKGLHMKTTKNTLIAASVTLAVALGCASFIDLGTNATNTPNLDTDVAKIEIESTLAWGIREDIIIIRPD